MDGWSVKDALLEFITLHAEGSVIVKNKSGWRKIIAMKAHGANIFFRVEGEEWDVDMHEVASIQLRLRTPPNEPPNQQ